MFALLPFPFETTGGGWATTITLYFPYDRLMRKIDHLPSSLPIFQILGHYYGPLSYGSVVCIPYYKMKTATWHLITKLQLLLYVFSRNITLYLMMSHHLFSKVQQWYSSEDTCYLRKQQSAHFITTSLDSSHLHGRYNGPPFAANGVFYEGAVQAFRCCAADQLLRVALIAITRRFRSLLPTNVLSGIESLKEPEEAAPFVSTDLMGKLTVPCTNFWYHLSSAPTFPFVFAQISLIEPYEPLDHTYLTRIK